MKYLVFFSLLLTFISCQKVRKPQKPENLISKEKMVDILTESYLANAARSIDNKTIIENGIKLDSFFYRKFNIDSLQFVKSNAYYAADIPTYTLLLESVMERIEKKNRQLDSIQKQSGESAPIRSLDTTTRRPKVFLEMDVIP